MNVMICLDKCAYFSMNNQQFIHIPHSSSMFLDAKSFMTLVKIRIGRYLRKLKQNFTFLEPKKRIFGLKNS